MSNAPRCERCGGTATRQRSDDDETVLKCIACGLERPYTGMGLSATATATAAATDWIEQVKIQIRVQVGRVKAIEGARAEAERLVKVLQVYGAKDIPELPWKAQRISGQPSGTRLTTASCSRCGRKATPQSFHRDEDTDTLVCRKSKECAERVAA